MYHPQQHRILHPCRWSQWSIMLHRKVQGVKKHLRHQTKYLSIQLSSRKCSFCGRSNHVEIKMEDLNMRKLRSTTEETPKPVRPEEGSASQDTADISETTQQATKGSGTTTKPIRSRCRDATGSYGHESLKVSQTQNFRYTETEKSNTNCTRRRGRY